MKKPLIYLTVLALAACTLSVLPILSEAEETYVRLLCLNIGKADCMLLSYQDAYFLIDTGYEQTYAALETALRQYGVERLSGVILTHCHKDHAGGLLRLSQREIAVDAWYAAAIYYDVETGEHPAVQAAAARGEEVTWLSAGDTIAVGEDAAFTVLGPLFVNTENENNNSLVMRFSSPHGSILFAGDMKEDEEYDLLAAGAFSPCDLLKVGHHGDGGATTKELLSAVRPRAAVILTSTFEEADTPAASTLRRLENAGCAVYVSQDAQDALLFTLKNGGIQAQDVTWEGVPSRAENVTLLMDVEDDTLTIVNGGSQALSLEGCLLYSSRGDEMLELPSAVIPAGSSWTVGTNVTKGSVDYTWNEKRVWQKKKRDAAILYDAFGRAIACTDNGMEE